MKSRTLGLCALALGSLCCLGASYRTANFLIEAADPAQAQRVGDTAEQYRHELALSWLGAALPQWSQPCPITVDAAPHLGAGGATSFLFDRGEVHSWRMTLQGSEERILDSVLPHEVTHTILASHFRRPLPRWADEGAASTVEHDSERTKQQRLLINFLQTNRGIAFSQLFAMRDYPDDVLPLYCQGHSLATFLIQQGGRRKYVEFVADGLRDERWPDALQRHYGIATLGALQDSWLAWVRAGSPALATSTPAKLLPATPGATLASSSIAPASAAPVTSATAPLARLASVSAADRRPNGPMSRAWRAKGSLVSLPDHAPAMATPQAASTQASRPQTPQPIRQLILEWSPSQSRTLR